MDKQLLLDIFHIPAQSGSEEEMQKFIIDFLRKEEIPYSIDSMGNLFNVNCMTKPLLNAHMDTVQDDTDSKLQSLVKIYNDQFLKGYGTIGADDKCGIYIILELLKKNEFNFLFTVQEEAGLVGSAFFMRQKDISYMPYGITFDRFGSSDIICSDNDYGTIEFEQALQKVGRDFGFRPERGLISDCDNINEQISTCNLSVGYYNHHTKHEFVDITELENAVNYGQAILDQVTEKFKVPEKSFSFGSYYGYNNWDYAHEQEDLETMTDAELEELVGRKEEKFYEDKFNLCCITKKYSKKLTYISALKDFVSPEGARMLFEDLENSGIVYEMYNEDNLSEDFDEELERALEE